MAENKSASVSHLLCTALIASFNFFTFHVGRFVSFFSMFGNLLL